MVLGLFWSLVFLSRLSLLRGDLLVDLNDIIKGHDEKNFRRIIGSLKKGNSWFLDVKQGSGIRSVKYFRSSLDKLVLSGRVFRDSSGRYLLGRVECVVPVFEVGLVSRAMRDSGVDFWVRFADLLDCCDGERAYKLKVAFRSDWERFLGE